MSASRRGLWARLALLCAALIWGSSFLIMKNATEVFPTFTLLGLRFTVGCAALALLFMKRLKGLRLPTAGHGAVLGMLLFGAYSVQTLGLIQTTPGKNAFLTAVYCVLVPFVTWIAFRQRPDKWNWLAAVFCLGGVGLVSLDGSLSLGAGDALTLAGGVLYALHMVAVARFSRQDDPVVLTLLQFGAAAVCAWGVALVRETFPAQVSGSAWGELIYLALFATAGALLLQNVGQKDTPPAAAAILLSLESVFGVMFSVIFYHEQVTLRLGLGFLLIFLAVVVSETKLSFLKAGRQAASQADAWAGPGGQ